tara:strand:- start:554 stop:715 length:162 start_codon:yes stop_codon:yes gene_type:complete
MQKTLLLLFSILILLIINGCTESKIPPPPGPGDVGIFPVPVGYSYYRGLCSFI